MALYRQGQYQAGLDEIERFLRQTKPDALADHDLLYLLTLMAACGQALSGPAWLATTVREDLTQAAVACLHQLDVQLSERLAVHQYQLGLPVAQETCTLAGRLFGKGHALNSRHLLTLGVFYESLEAYAQAREAWLQALIIAKRQGLANFENRLMAGTLQLRLGVLHTRMMQPAEAERFLTEAAKTVEPLPAANQPVVLFVKKTAQEYLAGLKQVGSGHLPQDAKTDEVDALSFLQTNLAAARRNFGQNHEQVATALNALGRYHRRINDHRQAEDYLRQAIEMMIRIDQAGPNGQAEGPASSPLAISLNELINLYQVMGKFQAGDPLLKQALYTLRPYLETGDRLVLIALNNLGNLYRQAGDYRQALACFQESVAAWQSVGGEAGPDYGAALANLALIQRLLGNYAAAEVTFRQALEISRAVYGEYDPRVAIILDNFGALYEEIGDYPQAQALYQQALDAFLDGQDFNLLEPIQLPEAYAQDVVLCLNNLANVTSRMKNTASGLFYRRAKELAQQALGERHPVYITVLANLASYYVWTGNYAEALSLFEQALALIKEVLGEQSQAYANALNGSARLSMELGRYAQAELYYRQVLEIYEASLGQDHPEYAIALFNLAELRAATEQAAEALPLMNQAQQIFDQTIGHIFSMASEQQRLGYVRSLQASLDLYFSLLLQHLSNVPEAIASGFELTLKRKAIGAEALAVQRDAVLGGHYPALQSDLQALSRLRMRIAQAMLAGPESKDPAEHRQMLSAWRQERNRLETALARQIPELNLTESLPAAGLEAVAASLPPATVLVEFLQIEQRDFRPATARGATLWKPTLFGVPVSDGRGSAWQGARYVAFVLVAGSSTPIMVDLGQAAIIDRLMADFRAALTGLPLARSPEARQQRGLFYGDELEPESEQDIGERLRQVLFDPLRPALAGCRRLILSPDGDLSRLPFEVLPTPEGERLIDQYQISYVNVGRDILRFGATFTGEPTAPVVIANPDFDLAGGTKPETGQPGDGGRDGGGRSRDLERAGLRFGPLPGTHQEGEDIAGLLGVSPIMAEAALEQRLKAVTSPRILHIATHGFFLPDQERDLNQELPQLAALPGPGNTWERLAHGLENPLLRSGLALAGANTWLDHGALPPEAEDGLLTAEDVTGLDLLATELVVLSACETGLGQVQVGEGVFGLRRAFMLAGAKTLVMSLWKVPDAQTQTLMVEFYQGLLTGTPRAEALRQAQLALKKEYPEPFYWGAFICQGNPESLIGLN